jgi:integrase
MAKTLTAVSIAALRKRSKRYEVRDAGCAGLRVCVFPSGAKSFVLRYRFRGASRKLTLAPVLIGAEPTNEPQMGVPTGLAGARKLATDALWNAKGGQDPAAKKRAVRASERKCLAEAAASEANTLQAIAREYLRRHQQLRTIVARERDLTLLFPKLGHLPLEQITRGQFARVLDEIADKHTPMRSDKVLGALSALLSWHAKRSDYVVVLAKVMRKVKLSDMVRTRLLSDEELRQLWATAQDAGLFGQILRFLILTATRRGEVAGMTWDELNPDGIWKIPGVRTKNSHDHEIPLSEAALAIVRAMPRIGAHVFTVTGGEFNSFSDVKKTFDKRSGVSGWVIHDCRRLARSLLSRIGINDRVSEMCLNHQPKVLVRTYDRHKFLEEKRAAFAALAALVERIVNPQPNIVALPVTR